MEDESFNIVAGIATYKRPEMLRNLLDSINRQALDHDGFRFSVMVVDNDCSDEIREIVQSYSEESHYKMLYFGEKARGISNVRNRMVSEFLKSDGDFLVFVDDDEQVCDGWLNGFVEAWKKTKNPIISGKVEFQPYNKGASKTLERYLTMRDSKRENLSEVDSFFSGNLFAAREVYENIEDPFDLHYNMSGGGDLAFCNKTKQMGYRFVHCSKAVVKELLPETRASFRWVFTRGFRCGCTHIKCIRLETKSKRAVVSKGLPYAVRVMGSSCKKMVKFVSRFDRIYLYDAIRDFYVIAGMFWGAVGGDYNEYKTIHGK